ncbi:serine carboxypeptidase S28-domain-containing protein [Coprinopsis sp. MPI-PUGE-AT-0042]|nr:serine carboxypeptidase S28-domain-containing protein [Coprinopsis sp. MPI-PUGE-AT-0042]
MRRPTVPPVEARANVPVVGQGGTLLPPYNTVYQFDQLKDHTKPSKGTFKQRFWFTPEFYQRGGPIVLYMPGEMNAAGYTGYLTNITFPGVLAQQQKGATIVLEHRFYGESNPYPDLSVKSLQVHTIQQAIDDLEYFAQNVELPMRDGDKVSPDKAPWILVGGSYAGALVSWTMVNKPGVFFAGYSSSGTVQAILDYWQYFEPVRLNMPKNCSADVQRVVSHLDDVFASGNETAISDIKDNFGLWELRKADDVLSALRNNLWDWQELQPGAGSGQAFYRFCDALEVDDGVSAPETGWGLEHALNAWGFYWRTRYYSQLCGITDAESCLGTFDTTLNFCCNEVGYLQNGAPEGHPSLVSRLIQPPYDLVTTMPINVPPSFSSTPVPNYSSINWKYKGWDAEVDRLIYVDGAPVRRVAHAPFSPLYLTNAFHCSDLIPKGTADPTVVEVRNKSLQQMSKWLKTWKPRPRWWPWPLFPFPVITRPTVAPGGSTWPFRTSNAKGKRPSVGWFRGTGLQ